MKYVVMENSGGELDRRPVDAGQSARDVLIRMVSELDFDSVFVGDVFRIEGAEEDEE